MSENNWPDLKDFKEKIENGFEDLLATWNNYQENDWNEVKKSNGVLVCSKKDPSSPIQRYFGRGLLSGNIEKVMELVIGLDHVREWDHSFKDGSIDHSYNKDCDIVYIRYTAGIPLIRDRDFVYLETRRKFDDGMQGILAFSLDDSVHETGSGCVRGEILVSGWLVKQSGEDPNKLEALYQLQINPKGWMPSWLVNMMFVDEPINIFKRIEGVLNKSS